MGGRRGCASWIGLVAGDPPLALVRTCCCCFLTFGVLCGAILGSRVVGWRDRHVDLTERRAAEAAALHCRHNKRLDVEVEARSS